LRRGEKGGKTHPIFGLRNRLFFFFWYPTKPTPYIDSKQQQNKPTNNKPNTPKHTSVAHRQFLFEEKEMGGLAAGKIPSMATR